MTPPRAKAVVCRARRMWNEDRAQLRRDNPAWEMPAWSRAPAWRRWPYLHAAACGVEIREIEEGQDDDQ